MNAIKCEMCSSTNLIKEDGYYVCQHCGTKYTVEEAKKLMIEGTVKIDTTDELEKLYKAARNAKAAGDDKTALMHYEAISAKDPDNWEAVFYAVVLKTETIKNGEIKLAAISIANSLPKVFELVATKIESDEEKLEVIETIISECLSSALWLKKASFNFYKSLTEGSGLMALTGITGAIGSVGRLRKELAEHNERCGKIALILYVCGTNIEKNFDMSDERYQKFLITAYKCCLKFDDEYYNEHKSRLFTNEFSDELYNAIKQYEPSFEKEEQQKSGCYVATCVYGSYDCPQVWTLRRYRDNTLASSWYGRLFIKLYYAVSPTLVKWFGHTKWFKKLWKGKLDKMVARLEEEGVENTPYEDKNW